MASTDNSDPTLIKELLPTCESTVDLTQPEEMNRSELLELFDRRGCASLVTLDEPIHGLIEKYYDHLMPLCKRSEGAVATISTFSVSPTPNATKRKSQVSLEDLVITSDPKRLTPGLSDAKHQKVEDRVLTVRYPSSTKRELSHSEVTSKLIDENSTTAFSTMSTSNVSHTLPPVSPKQLQASPNVLPKHAKHRAPVALEDIIITSDPKRITPGLSDVKRPSAEDRASTVPYSGSAVNGIPLSEANSMSNSESGTVAFSTISISNVSLTLPPVSAKQLQESSLVLSNIVKHKSQVALEDLVIISDPNRTTPGLSSASEIKRFSIEERVLTVRHPKAMNHQTSKTDGIPKSSDENGTMGSNNSENDNLSISGSRKRTKLRRNFVEIA